MLRNHCKVENMHIYALIVNFRVVVFLFFLWRLKLSIPVSKFFPCHGTHACAKQKGFTSSTKIIRTLFCSILWTSKMSFHDKFISDIRKYHDRRTFHHRKSCRKNVFSKVILLERLKLELEPLNKNSETLTKRIY